MKKTLALILAWTMLLLCGVMQAGLADGDIVIHVWGGITAENGPDQICENFNASHPGYRAEYTYYTNDDAGNTKLDTALLSNEIDAFISHDADRFSARVTNGLCVKLDDYLAAAGINVLEDFGMSSALVDGSFYALAVTDTRDFIWINEDIFQAEGLEIPTSWTYDEYKEIAKRLTTGENENKRYGTMIHYSWANSWMRPAFVALGFDVSSDEYVYDLENPYFARALQLRYDMEVTDGSMVPTALAKTTGLTVQGMFLTGQTAMFHGGSWVIRYAKNLTDYPHDFKIAFAPLPHWSDTENYYNSTMSLGEYMSVSTKSANPDAAFEFIKYWATDGYYPLCAGGKVPAWVHADMDQVLGNLIGGNAADIFDIDTVKQVLFGKQNYFTVPVVAGRSEVISALSIEADKYFAEEQSLDETIANMKDAARSVLDSYR
ncbi:MAG: extracellular solute-binding protein [Clostridia bacterium]|nr:extracellular solute-binding protein [Clostridia bacterium]